MITRDKFAGKVLKGRVFEQNFGSPKRNPRVCNVAIDYICGPYGRKLNKYAVHVALSKEDSQRVCFAERGQIMMNEEEIVDLIENRLIKNLFVTIEKEDIFKIGNQI